MGSVENVEYVQKYPSLIWSSYLLCQIQTINTKSESDIKMQNFVGII